MVRHLMLSIAAVGVLAACSGENSPTPVRADTEYLAFVERIDLVVACVEEHGFEASSYEGFGVMIDAASEQQLDVASRIEGECWEEVEQRFPAPPPLSIEETYYYMLDVADCLRDLGYDIPEAPSVETYVDQSAAQSDMWDPYTHLGLRGADTWELQRVCPPAPWAR